MKYTQIANNNEDRELAVNGCDWYGNESDVLQLTVEQHGDRSFIDLDLDETVALRDKLTEHLEERKLANA